MMGIRFLGGVDFNCIGQIYGVHPDTASNHVIKCLFAIDKSASPLLSTDLLPKTHTEFESAAKQWDSLSSSGGMMYGVIVVIDGWLCTTITTEDITNPADYFSGHYQRYGINVQAICDDYLRVYICWCLFSWSHK